MGTLIRGSTAPVFSSQPLSVFYLPGNGLLYLPHSVSALVIFHTGGKVSFSLCPVYEVVAPFILMYAAFIFGKHPRYKGLRRIGIFSQRYPTPILKESILLDLIALERVFSSYEPIARTKNLLNKRWGKVGFIPMLVTTIVYVVDISAAAR